MRFSVKNSFLRKTYLIWAEAATVFLFGRVQINGKFVFETKFLVPRDEDRGDRPDEGSVSSQETEGSVDSVGCKLTVIYL